MSRCWTLALRCGKFVVELLWARPFVVSAGGVVQHVRSRCPCSGVWLLIASAFNRLCQCVNSPGNRGHAPTPPKISSKYVHSILSAGNLMDRQTHRQTDRQIDTGKKITPSFGGGYKRAAGLAEVGVKRLWNWRRRRPTAACYVVFTRCANKSWIIFQEPWLFVEIHIKQNHWRNGVFLF